MYIPSIPCNSDKTATSITFMQYNELWLTQGSCGVEPDVWTSEINHMSYMIAVLCYVTAISAAFRRAGAQPGTRAS
jgi:hypothetical protein